MGKAIGERVLELYADPNKYGVIDGFTAGDAATVKKEYGLDDQQTKLLMQGISDGRLTQREKTDLEVSFHASGKNHRWFEKEFSAITAKNGEAAFKKGFQIFSRQPKIHLVKQGKTNHKATFIEKPVKLQGIYCQGKSRVEFYKNGQLAAATLGGSDTKWFNFPLKQGSRVEFHDNGNYKQGTLGQDYSMVGFTLPADTTLTGDEQGKVTAKLSAAMEFEVPGSNSKIELPPGTQIHFDKNRDVQKIVLPGPVEIFGVRFQAGDVLTFPGNGGIENTLGGVVFDPKKK